MIKRRIFAIFLVAATLSMPGPAFANHGDPIYNIRYYSDSTYTVEVGQDLGACYYFGAGYYGHTGQSTAYPIYELIGYCDRGIWEPF